MAVESITTPDGREITRVSEIGSEVITVFMDREMLQEAIRALHDVTTKTDDTWDALVECAEAYAELTGEEFI